MLPLEDIVGRVQNYFMPPNTVEKMRRELLQHYLPPEMKRRLDGMSPEQRQAVYTSLDAKLHQRLTYQQENLNRLSLKLGQGVGLVTLLNDAYAMYRGIPFKPHFYLENLLITGKAILELPTMYRYLKRSHDWYGALEWLGTKVLAGLIPILGPMLDYKVAQRVIKRHVMNQALEDLMKEQKLYQPQAPMYRQVYDRVAAVAGPFRPYQPAPAYVA